VKRVDSADCVADLWTGNMENSADDS